MPPSSAVLEHFDRRAASYHDASTRWPWSRVRAVESAAVFEALGDVTDRRVLELGAGAGFYTRALLDRGAASVVAVDLAPGMVAALPDRRVEGVVGDAATVVLDETFDVVLSAGLLEFVDDPAAVLANAARHASPGARMVLLVPAKGLVGTLYRAFHRSGGVTVRLFSPADLARLADATGWEAGTVVRAHAYALVLPLRRR